MFNSTHTDHLRGQLAASQLETSGWQQLVDHAIPRFPHAVVDNLSYQLSASRERTDGWHLLLEYALGVTAPGADLDQYATGARLDAPAPPCTCGRPETPGMVHLGGGRPCYRVESPVPIRVAPERGDGQAVSLLPPLPPQGGNPYPPTPPARAGDTVAFAAFGELPPAQAKAADTIIADHLAQDHEEALKDNAKWDRKRGGGQA